MKLPARACNFLLLIAVCIMLLFSAHSFSQTEHATVKNDPYFKQDISFTDTLGKSHHIADFKDRKIIVHFWATWCIPCVKELPVLLKRIAGQPDITLIVFSTDQNAETMNNFLTSIQAPQKPNILYVWDKDSQVTSNVFKVFQFPESFIFDKNLQLSSHVQGNSDWTTQKL